MCSMHNTSRVAKFHFVHTDLVPSSVVKTQSRRHSVLVCSLLVVSFLLSAAVGQSELVTVEQLCVFTPVGIVVHAE